MRGSRIAVCLMVVFAVPIAYAATARAASDTAMRLKIGDRAPDFKLKDVMTGKTVTLSEFAGKKVVMLEFWATWCDICKREMPNLVKLRNDWGPKGFELLSIVLPSGNVNDIKKIITEKKLNYPFLLDSDLSVATKLYGLAGHGLGSCPAFFLTPSAM